MNRITQNILAGALLCLSACENVDTQGVRAEDNDHIDSLVTVFTPPPGLRSLDILIYKASGLKTLESYIRKEWKAPDVSASGDTVRIILAEGDKIIAAVGNHPYPFKTEALKNFDSAAKLCANYADEDTDYPLTSLQCSCKAGDSTALQLSRLLSGITLSEISQKFENYRRLENPRVFLSNAAASVELFRESGFRPAQTISDTLGLYGLIWSRLPYDIGFSAQHPDIRLFCYPNDDGPVRTRITVQGEYRDSTVHFSSDLPPVSRYVDIKVKLTINSTPEDYDFHFDY